MTDLSSQQKGDALEDAVRAIESAILRTSPAYSDSTFRIEPKKIVVVSGVRHEIDLYVTADLGPGYGSVFIFECKNWSDPVGKNEIIVFSEKIRATNAQKGFFVATSLTADARAQAASNPRIELLAVSSLDPASVMVPMSFHSVFLGATQASILAFASPERLGTGDPIKLDPAAAVFQADGVAVPFDTIARQLVEAARADSMTRFASGKADEGVNRIPFGSTTLYEDGQVAIDGRPVRRLDVTGTVEVHVNRAVVTSVFEVASRGRHITTHIRTPFAEIGASFVELSPT